MKQSQDEKETQAEFKHSSDCGGVQSQNGSRSDAMSCEQVEARIHDLMDQRLPLLSDRLVRDHISDCDQCAELVVDFGALDESLSQIPLATLKRLSDLGAEEVSQAGTRRPLHPFSFIVSVASVLLVMLTSGSWFADSSQSIPSNREVARASDPAPADVRPGFGASNPLPFNLGHKTTVPTEFISAVDFSDIRREVEPIWQITAELPGISPMTGPVNATLWFLIPASEDGADGDSSDSPDRPSEAEATPELGFRRSTAWMLCCV